MENIMSSKLFTTRQGTVLLGVIAAIIAAVALIVYLNHYRNSVKGTNVAIPVLVAKSLIQKGTSGDVVGSTGLYVKTNLPKSQVKTGAFVDPSTLAGKVALTDIYPNQQLTAADFGISTTPLLGKVDRNQRAVVVPLGSPQQVGGQIAAGSHVDVWVAFNGINRELFQNMYVLAVSGGNVTFRATPQQAGVLIFASANASIWLALRPTVATIQKKPAVVSTKNLQGR
jgi:Flp pilus assembly protein CpaB